MIRPVATAIRRRWLRVRDFRGMASAPSGGDESPLSPMARRAWDFVSTAVGIRLLGLLSPFLLLPSAWARLDRRTLLLLHSGPAVAAPPAALFALQLEPRFLLPLSAALAIPAASAAAWWVSRHSFLSALGRIAILLVAAQSILGIGFAVYHWSEVLDRRCGFQFE